MEGIAYEHQRLFIGNRILDPTRTLEHYNIANESTIHLIIDEVCHLTRILETIVTFSSQRYISLLMRFLSLPLLCLPSRPFRDITLIHARIDLV